MNEAQDKHNQKVFGLNSRSTRQIRDRQLEKVEHQQCQISEGVTLDNEGDRQ